MPSPQEFPYQDGDVTVLGPEIFASKGGAVISWRGENYVRQNDVQPRSDEMTVGALHELCSAVRDLTSAVRLETADRQKPTPETRLDGFFNGLRPSSIEDGA